MRPHHFAFVVAPVMLIVSLGQALSAPSLAASRADLPPAASRAAGHRGDRTTWDSVYTRDQAARGQVAYAATCSRCHQESLGGADESPALAGGTFLSKWSGLTISELHDRVRTTMPPDDPGTYGRQQISDVLAYVLSANGFPSGRVELPVVAAELQAIRIEATRR